MPIRKQWLSYSEIQAEFEKRIANTDAANSFLRHAIRTHLIGTRFREISKKPILNNSSSIWYEPETRQLTKKGSNRISFNRAHSNLEMGHLALCDEWGTPVMRLEGVEFDWRDLAKIFGRKGVGGRAIQADSWARLNQTLFKMALEGEFASFTSLSEFKREVREALDDREPALHVTSYDKDLEQIWNKFSKPQ